MDGRERKRHAGRLRVDGRVIYDLSIATGVVAVTAGVSMKYGPAIALMVFGGLVIGLSLFAASRMGEQ